MDRDQKPRSLIEAERAYKQHHAVMNGMTSTREMYERVRVQLPARLGGFDHGLTELSIDRASRFDLEFVLGRWLDEQVSEIPAPVTTKHAKAAAKAITSETHPDPTERFQERLLWQEAAALAQVLDTVSRGDGGAFSRAIASRLNGKLVVTPELISLVRRIDDTTHRGFALDMRLRRELEAIPTETLEALAQVAKAHQATLDDALEAEFTEAWESFYEAWDQKDEELAERMREEEAKWRDRRLGSDRARPHQEATRNLNGLDAPDRGDLARGVTTHDPAFERRMSDAWTTTSEVLGATEARRDAFLESGGTDRVEAARRDADLVAPVDAMDAAAAFPAMTQPTPAPAGPIQAWLEQFVAERPGIARMTAADRNATVAEILNAGREHAAELQGLDPVTPLDVEHGFSGLLDGAAAAAPTTNLVMQAGTDALQSAANSVAAHARTNIGLNAEGKAMGTLLRNVKAVAVERFGLVVTDGDTTTFVPGDARVPVRLGLDPSVLNATVTAAFDAAAAEGFGFATPTNLAIVDPASTWKQAFADLGFSADTSTDHLVVFTNTGIER